MNSGDDEPPLLNSPQLSRRRVLTIAGSTVAAAVLAACRDDGPYANATPSCLPVTPNGIVVDIQSIDNTFRPDRIEITPGTEVRWTNLGRAKHDIIPVEGTEWGVAEENLPPGATYSHVFGCAGEVSYYCSIHGVPRFGMVGTIVIVEETAN